MPTEWMLALLACVTSAIAAVIGFGGGMLLIALLPMFVAPSLIIPLHGLTQLASNSSRMLFSIAQVQWSLLPKFLVGSLLGCLVFGYLLSNLASENLPFAIGCYILLSLWSPHFNQFMQHYQSYYLIGFMQTGLGLIVGATGPLSLALLSKQLQSPPQVIATSALFMSISHLAKLPVYFSISSELESQLPLLLMMLLGAISGSWLGNRISLRFNPATISIVIKLLLSLLALQMLLRVVLKHIA